MCYENLPPANRAECDFKEGDHQNPYQVDSKEWFDYDERIKQLLRDISNELIC